MANNVEAAVDAAYGTIVQKLAAPYFFEKLAAAGIRPRNAVEAGELWELGQKLQMLYASTQEKAAADEMSTLQAWNAEVDAILSGADVGHVEKKADWSEYASAAAEHPEIAEAALTLQAAAAAALSSAN